MRNPYTSVQPNARVRRAREVHIKTPTKDLALAAYWRPRRLLPVGLVSPRGCRRVSSRRRLRCGPLGSFRAVSLPRLRATQVWLTALPGLMIPQTRRAMGSRRRAGKRQTAASPLTAGMSGVGNMAGRNSVAGGVPGRNGRKPDVIRCRVSRARLGAQPRAELVWCPVVGR